MAVVVYPNCNDTVAHQPGVVAAVVRVARQRAAVARGVVLARRAEGHTTVTVTSGDVDSFVNLVDRDPGRGSPAAAAIEFGNRHGGGGVGALSKAFGLRGRR